MTSFFKPLAVATLGLGVAFSASTGAEAGPRYYNGGALAAGIIGGVAAGALIAGAARPAYAAPVYGGPVYPAPVRYAPAYEEPVYEYVPVCTMRRQQVWLDDYTYTYRRVRVCR